MLGPAKDIGPAGGVRVLEPATAHQVLEDSWGLGECTGRSSACLALFLEFGWEAKCGDWEQGVLPVEN